MKLSTVLSLIAIQCHAVRDSWANNTYRCVLHDVPHPNDGEDDNTEDEAKVLGRGLERFPVVGSHREEALDSGVKLQRNSIGETYYSYNTR